MAKYSVYYNDGVNEAVEAFSEDTLEECKQWIDREVIGKIPVDDDHSCTDDVFYSSRTFLYEVYDRPIVETVDDEDIFNEPVYSSGYYYAEWYD